WRIVVVRQEGAYEIFTGLEFRRVLFRSVERKIAVDETHLAGVDIAFLDLRQRLVMELAAMGTGQRGIFHDRHRRIGLAEHVFGRSAERRVGRAARSRAATAS